MKSNYKNIEQMNKVLFEMFNLIKADSNSNYAVQFCKKANEWVVVDLKDGLHLHNEVV